MSSARVVVLLFCAVVLAVAAGSDSHAATPPSGNLSTAHPSLAWDFAPVVGGTVTSVGLEDVCPPGPCDDFQLTLSLPSPAATFYKTMTATMTVTYTWTSSLPSDLDVFAYGPNGSKYGPGSPDDTTSGAGKEVLSITDPVDGLWHVRSVGSTTPMPTAAHAVVTLKVATRPTTQIPPPPPGSARYHIFPAPESITPAAGSSTAGQHDAGEPSIGANWLTNQVMYEAGNHSLRVTFTDTSTGTTAHWADKRSPFARVTLDPILFTDSKLGRTFESQLDGACSTMSYTEDDGNTWIPTEGCGTPAGPDHQTIGAGPFATPAPAVHTWPHAVYYCSQGIAAAICARSDDGGITFGPGIPIYDLTQCGGLHGHIKVAPDGTAYVPNKSCGGKQAVVVSEDNGLTWSVRAIPDSASESSGGDPSVGIGANGTVYFGYVDGNGHARIAVSHDRGLHWTKSKDAGTYYGIQNAEFPEVVAGDDDRAAFAFLGTTTPGNDQAASFPGVWYLYVAITYDGGNTWTADLATPHDPVQRGCIWNGGGSNQCRNLLDFNDITVDKHGRVLVGFADGCTGGCVTDPNKNTFDALATIARQSHGKGLFSKYDGTW